MTHRTTLILREEHAALAAVARTILLLLERHRRPRELPDFRALRALVFYLDEFPEKHHHRLESELLFAKLRARTPLSRALLDRLDEEHARGEHLIGQLLRELLAFEMLGEARRAGFEETAQRFHDFYMAHMRLEEEQILPLAEQVLADEDWSSLDEAFTHSRDPAVDYDALFSQLLRIVPAPLGYGSAAAPT